MLMYPQKHFSMKQLTDKQKVIIVVISLLIWLGLSVFFCLAFKWWAAFIPSIALFLIEWICRAFYGDFTPPLYKYLKGKITRKQPKEIPTKPQTTILITSISEWLVKQMMDCAYHGNYSSIGSGPGIVDHFNELMQQYYDMKGDEESGEYKKFMKRKIVLANFILGIELNAFILKERYSLAAVKYLRQQTPKFEYTRISYKKDAENILKSIVGKKMDLEVLEKQIAEFHKGKGKEKVFTPLEKEGQMNQLIYDISNIEGVKYSLKDMTVMELAVGEKRRLEHIKRIEEQIKANKEKHRNSNQGDL